MLMGRFVHTKKIIDTEKPTFKARLVAGGRKDPKKYLPFLNQHTR